MLDVTSPPAALRRRLASVDVATWTLGAVAVVGAVLRLRAYASHRSLWLDESLLAVDVIRTSAAHLFGSLHYNQAAAPGFLAIEKAMALSSRGELVLRLPSLVFGLTCLVLVCLLVRGRLRPVGATLAVALVAVAPAAVYYSSELKQYAGDAMATAAVILAAAVFTERERPSRGTTAAAAAVGVGALVISQSALFTLGSAGAVVGAAALSRRRRAELRHAALLVGIWGLAAALSLADTLGVSSHVLSTFAGSTELGEAGSGGTGGGSGPHLQFARVLVNALGSDLGLAPSGAAGHLLTGVAVLLAGCGFVSLLLRRRAVLASLLLAPVVLTTAANTVHHYPITGRTVLFLVPLVAVLVAEGAVFPLTVLRPPALAVGVAVAAAALVVLYPARTEARQLRSPIAKEDLRQLLPRLNAAKRPGDRLFVRYSTQYALAYYAACGCGPSPAWHLVPAKGDQHQWAPALRSTADVTIEPHPVSQAAALRLVRALPPGRTWLLSSHVAGVREQGFVQGPFLAAFAKRGRLLETIRTPDAFAMLFDLRS